VSRALKRIFHVEDQSSDYSSYSPNANNASSTDHGSSDRGATNTKTTLSVSDENCIVQCPCCFTRFSLPASAINGQSDPHFHCSQCDTIFRAEVENPPAAKVESKTAPFLSTEFSTQEHTNNPIVDTLVSGSFDEVVDPQVFGSYSSTSETGSSAAINIQQDDETSSSKIFKDSGVSQTYSAHVSESSKSFEIPRSVSSEWSLGPPHESAAQLFEFPKSSKNLPEVNEPSQINLALNTRPVTQMSEHKGQPTHVGQANYGEPLLQTFPNQSPSSNPRKAPKTKKGEVSIKRRQLLLSSVRKINFNLPLGAWRGPLVIAGPLVSFCFALFFISAFLKTNPLESEEMITAAIPGITRVAPPGLAVIEARLRKITLESGESILALSGRVKNNSGKTIKRITLDGLVFDKQGMLLGEKQVLVSSPLAQSKIRSLSLEMIEDIEANASKGKTTVKDGESAPFVVTFRPQEVGGARYFSTRINSIK
jgi:hypothetical protein